MQTIVLYLCYIVLILLFSTAYTTSLIILIYCFVIWCLHTNKRRPCSSTLSGHLSSSSPGGGSVRVQIWVRSRCREVLRWGQFEFEFGLEFSSKSQVGKDMQFLPSGRGRFEFEFGFEVGRSCNRTGGNSSYESGSNCLFSPGGFEFEFRFEVGRACNGTGGFGVAREAGGDFASSSGSPAPPPSVQFGLK